MVPGAKLLPTTVKGPEAPLIEIPAELSRTFACPAALLRAAARRLLSVRRPFAGLNCEPLGPEGAESGGWLFRVLELVDAERYSKEALECHPTLQHKKSEGVA